MTDYSNTPLDLNAISQFSALEFTPMAKNYPKLHSLQTLFSWSLPLIASIVFIFFSKIDNIPSWPYLIIGFVIMLSVYHSYHAAKAMGYILREKDILYKRGVFWKKRTGVSFKRIQHIDITHGPIERKFELATIKFFTAGGSQADLRISGLPKQDAEKLRSIILEKAGLTND